MKKLPDIPDELMDQIRNYFLASGGVVSRARLRIVTCHGLRSYYDEFLVWLAAMGVQEVRKPCRRGRKYLYFDMSHLWGTVHPESSYFTEGKETNEQITNADHGGNAAASGRTRSARRPRQRRGKGASRKAT